jgi:hypothetical protein
MEAIFIETSVCSTWRLLISGLLLGLLFYPDDGGDTLPETSVWSARRLLMLSFLLGLLYDPKNEEDTFHGNVGELESSYKALRLLTLTAVRPPKRECALNIVFSTHNGNQNR